MTPAARIAAAIEILDDILSGTSAEKALKDWARGHRFAGSKDRAALRDHVFDGLRQRRSLAALGGAETGRGLMIGLVRASGAAVDTVFNGDGYAPCALSDEEAAAGARQTAQPRGPICPTGFSLKFWTRWGRRPTPVSICCASGRRSS